MLWLKVGSIVKFLKQGDKKHHDQFNHNIQ